MTSASRIAQASPVPAQTMDGLDGATASAPIAWTGVLSNTGVLVTPPSVLFHTPPDAEPKQSVSESPGTPATAEMRPPPAGPMNRKRGGSGGRFWPGPRPWAGSGERLAVVGTAVATRRMARKMTLEYACGMARTPQEDSVNRQPTYRPPTNRLSLAADRRARRPLALQPVPDPLPEPAQPVHQQPRLAAARQLVRGPRIPHQLH